MDVVEYAINIGIYYLMALLVLAPYGILVVAVIFLLRYLGVEEGSGTLKGIGLVLLLPYILLPSYIASKAARNRVEHLMGFYESFQSAITEVRGDLSFLPVIGSLFVKKPKPDRQ